MMKLTEGQKVEIIQKYKTGNFTCKQLCYEYNIQSSTISYLMKSRGIKVNRSFPNVNRKYSLNQNYFDKIDTEDKAYFLGLLYADGYNNEPKNLVTIGLQETDIKILEKFNEFICSNRPFCISKLNEKNKNHQNSIILSINSKRISKNLSKLGCYKAKSFTLKFPTEDQVPKHLLNHFIRGYVDGDGSISIGIKNNIRCSLISSIYFCQSLQNFLKTIDIDSSISHQNNSLERNISTRQLCIKGGQSKILEFLQWLYKDSTVYLDRKYQKYINYNHPLERSSVNTSTFFCAIVIS